MPPKLDQPTISLPTSLSRKGIALVCAALHLVDKDGVATCADTMRVLSVQRSSFSEALDDVTEHRLARKLNRTPGAFRLAYSRIFVSDVTKCELCPRAVIPGASKARYCATCIGALVRHDRAWRTHAFEVWASAPRGDSDAKIVYRIHAQTKQPLYTREAKNREETKDFAEGIVNWMVRMGMIDAPEWTERIRAKTQGLEGEE